MIVIDGGSSDGSVELLVAPTLKRLRFVSEADNGIFDAQRKGAAMAEGQYLLFLNAGDLLAEPTSAKEIIDTLESSPAWLLAGCIDLKGSKGPEEFNHSPSWWRHAFGLRAYCQQSIAYSRGLFDVLEGFDFVTVGLAADFDFNLRAGLVSPPKQLLKVVTLYEGAGISSTSEFQAKLPRMMHDVRVNRHQLSGPIRIVDKIFTESQVLRKHIGSFRRKFS